MTRANTLDMARVLLVCVLLAGCRSPDPTPVSYVPTPERETMPAPRPTITTRATIDPLGKGLLAARDAALEFIRRHEPTAAMPEKLLWIGQNSAPEGLVGVGLYRYDAGAWVVALRYPLTAEPDYKVAVSNSSSGFAWEGVVSSDGRVEPEEKPVPVEVLSAQEKVLLYLSHGRTIALPAAARWSVENITPKGLAESATYRFVSGDWVVTVQYPLVSHPAYEVRVWNKGTGFDWGGYVTSGGEVREAVAGEVRAWEGRVVPLCRAAQFDDFFERDTGERYGIDGVDDDTDQALALAACETLSVRVWGELRAGVPDAGGRQILAGRVEVVDQSVPANVRETPDGAVDAWTGTIRPTCRSSPHDDYLEREDGQRFGVKAENDKVQQDLVVAVCEELPVKIWGQLVSEDDYHGRRVIVTSIEFIH